MRQCQRVLNTITEQIPVRQQRQRVMKCQLSQFLLERLALADVVKIEREPVHRRVVRQVAADDLQDEALETVSMRSSTGPTVPFGVAATSARNALST